KIREFKSVLSGPYVGPVSRTQTFLVMSQDDAGGQLYLDEDRLRISWPGAGERPPFPRDNAQLERASKALGGIFLRDPIWTKFFGHSLITVHPLGGCGMARSAEEGVVNHKGQVF